MFSCSKEHSVYRAYLHPTCYLKDLSWMLCHGHYYNFFFQASDQKDCSPCRENVNRLFVQFKTEYEFGISHFNENVCPQMSDSDNCVTKNTEWWPYLSQIIYSDQAPKYVCEALDPDCTFK